VSFPAATMQDGTPPSSSQILEALQEFLKEIWGTFYQGKVFQAKPPVK
jgi:hypothetical protein